MKIFTLKKVAAGAALFSLFACGDDSSSGSKDQDIFSTKDDLPECTEKIAGDTLYVESDSADYFCEDGKWILVGDTTGTTPPQRILRTFPPRRERNRVVPRLQTPS